MHRCNEYSIGAINVCTDFEMNRYKIEQFRKHLKNRMFYLMSCDTKLTLYVMHDGCVMIGIFIRNILKPTRMLYENRLKHYG